MQLSTHDLAQLTEGRIRTLSPDSLITLTLKLLADVMELHDRLNQNPQNSSRPPSSRAPWEKSGAEGSGNGQEDTSRDADVAPSDLDEEVQGLPHPGESEPDRNPLREEITQKGSQTKRKPGKQHGAPGHGRKFGENLEATRYQEHRPQECTVCNLHLPESAPSGAHTARYEMEIERPSDEGPGLNVTKTKHTYFETQCQCGHWSRCEPGRCAEEEGWTVGLTEWHVAGPMLVTFIGFLALRMRMSRPLIHELLYEWVGIYISTGTINQCIHEAGRAVEPVVRDEIMVEVRKAEQLHVDETGWPQHTLALWLWVFTCTTVTLFVVGRRTREMVLRVLGDDFAGWLISDGYTVYRDYLWRQRCLAHLLRKARGLKESLDPQAREFGKRTCHLLKTLMDAVYLAREKPPDIALSEQHAIRLDMFWAYCEQHWDAEHEKTRALAREFLYDWNAFWAVLDYLDLPLTNNEAERALRHWVIWRRISYGTRTAEGSHAFCLLASVIETCRLRKASPWRYIAEVIRQRRKGMPAPCLPKATA